MGLSPRTVVAMGEVDLAAGVDKQVGGFRSSSAIAKANGYDISHQLNPRSA